MERQNSALESNCLVLDSKIGGLINKLSKMSQKATIESDLSQVLDDFLQKLNECDKYLENGIFNMNFAEAALLLQSSADIYSKKVDLLWDIIFDYQKRILLSDDQNANQDQEIEKLEERKRKYKRKHKTKETETRTTKLVSNFSFGHVEYVDYLNQTYEPHDLLQEWEKFHIETPVNSEAHRGQSSNKNSLFLPNNAVHTEDNDYVGRYDQFHSASLIQEIFHLEKENLIRDDCSCVTQMRIDSYIINDFLLENSIPSNRPFESYACELNQYINNFRESRSQTVQKVEISDSSLPLTQEICCKESFVTLEKLPSNTIGDNLRRSSLADSLFDDDRMSSISDTCNNNNEDPVPEDCNKENIEITNQNEVTLDQIAGGLEKRNQSCSQDSAFYEVEDGDDLIRTPLPITPINIEAANISNNQLPCCGGSIVIPRQQRSIKRKLFLEQLKPEDFKEEVKKRKVLKKRISEKVLRRLVTGITVNLRDFEKFCRLQYEPGDHEGLVPPYLSESEESDGDENGDLSEEEEMEHHFEDNCTILDPALAENDEVDNLEVPPAINSTAGDPPAHPVPEITPSILEITPSISEITPSIPEHPVIPLVLTPEELEAEEQMRKNVREWRAFILPKLKVMNNRSDFDIHEYGSKIIEPTKIGEERTFKTIVLGKNAAEVARYFIATLQLANTNNVEILGAVPGQIANDTFRVKTLDKTKHHELLEDYQAPSEETFRERLERVKAMNPKIPLHSTPLVPPAKKIKLRGFSGKKLF